MLRLPDAHHPGPVLQRDQVQHRPKRLSGADLPAQVHVHGRYDLSGRDACQAGLPDKRHGHRVPGPCKARLDLAGRGKVRYAQ